MSAIQYSSPIDLLLNEIQNVRAQLLAADPGAPVTGQFWYDSTNNVFKYRNNVGTISVIDSTAALALKASLASPVFTGDPQAPTPATADNDTSIATTAYVKANLALYATLASPVLTGDPQAPTPLATDNDQSIATTAFVKTQIANLINGAGATLDTLNELALAIGNDANFATTITNSLATKAGKFSQNVGDGALSTIVVTHNLNTTDTIVQVRNIASKKKIVVDIEDTSVNTTTLLFSTAPALNAFRVTVLG